MPPRPAPVEFADSPRYQPTRPDDRPAPRPTGPAPRRPPAAPTSGPRIVGDVPKPVSAAGFTNMRQFNRNLERVMRAYRRVNGVAPSPAVAWDLTRASLRFDLDDRQMTNLLRAPTAKSRRKTKKALREFKEYTGVEMFTAPGSRPPRQYGPTLGDTSRMRDLTFAEQRELSAEAARQAGIDPGEMPGMVLRDPNWGVTKSRQAPERSALLNLPILFFTQGGEMLSQLPYGAWQTIKDVSEDINDFASAVGYRIVPEVYGGIRGDLTFRRTREMADQMVEQVKEDFSNPLENPFYVALDVFSIATLGASSGARLTAGIKAGVRDKSVASGVAKAIQRPLPDVYVLGAGAGALGRATVENAALRILLRGVYANRQQQIARHLAGDPTTTAPGKTGRWVSRYIGPEAVYRREIQAQKAFEYKLATIPAEMLSRATRVKSLSRIVLRETLKDPRALRTWRPLSRRTKAIVDNAIWLHHLPDADPIGTMRETYRREIERWDAERDSALAGGEVEAARGAERVAGKLRGESMLLEDTARMLENPPKALEPILARAAEVSDGQARLKQQLFGWDDEVLVNHLLEEAAFYKGIEYLPGEGVRILYVKTPLGEIRIEPPTRERVARGEALVAGLTQRQAELRARFPDIDERAKKGQYTTEELRERRSVKRQLLILEPKLVRKRQELTDMKALREQAALPGRELIEGEVRRSGMFDSIRPFYVPDVSELRPGRQTVLGARGGGQFGLSPPTGEARWAHRWTGKNFSTGRRTIDTSDLIVEEARKVAKFAIQRDQWHIAWQFGRKTAKGIPEEFLGYVRDVNSIPERMRETVLTIEKEKIRDGETRHMNESLYDDAMRIIFPSSRKDLEPGVNYRYVDVRLLPDMAGVWPAYRWAEIEKAMADPRNLLIAAPNELGRIVYLFGRLGYGVNFLGAGALALIQQGPLAFENLIRSYQLERGFGDWGAQAIREAAGVSKTASLLTPTGSGLSRLSFAMGTAWAKITDNVWRQAAIIHELRRRDIRSEDGTAGEFFERLRENDSDALQTMNVVKTRANKAMVQMDNLTWPERAVLRNLLFIYTWVSRSAVYSLRFLMENPLQAEVFGQAGRDYEGFVERILGKMPEWFTRQGYIPIWKSYAMSPLQFNTPASINEIAYPLSTIWNDTKYADLLGTLQPGVRTMIDMLTASTSEQQGGLVEALLETVSTTPYGAAFARNEAEPRPNVMPVLAPEDLGPGNILSYALQDERRLAEYPTFETDGFWASWGPLLAGSLSLKNPDEQVAAAKFWRDMRETDLPKFMDHQRKAAQEMLTRQGRYMAQKVPRPARDAVNLISELTLKMERFVDETGLEGGVDGLGARQKLLLTLDYLRDRNLISQEDGEKIRKQARKFNTPDEISRMRMGVLDKYGRVGPLRDWIQTVKAVREFETKLLDRRLEVVRAEGLGDYLKAKSAPKTARRKYARQIIEFNDLRDQVIERLGLDRDNTSPRSPEELSVAFATIREFEERYDRPVVVDGVTFPSPVRYWWAEQPESFRRERLADDVASKPWQWLPAWEKEMIVGRAPSANVQKGWLAYTEALTNYKLSQPPGKRTVTRDQREALARQVNGTFPGFLADWQFDEAPLATRVAASIVVRESQNRDKWAGVLANAQQITRNLGPGGYSDDYLKDLWRDYVETTLTPWLEQPEQAGFRAELAEFGDTFLYNLID